MCTVYASTHTPQIVPHLTNAIQDWIERVSKIPVDDSGEEPDVCIIEVPFFNSRTLVYCDERICSSEAPLETLSLPLSLKRCGNFNFVWVGKTLLLFTSVSSRTFMANKKRNPHRCATIVPSLETLMQETIDRLPSEIYEAWDLARI